VRLEHSHLKHLEAAFKQVAVHPDRPTKKICDKVKYFDNDAKIQDYYMTEESLLQGFEKLFGHRCDILAKMLYMKASRGFEDAKLSLRDFYNLFQPFMVSYYL
jgi:hypothetical protein